MHGVPGQRDARTDAKIPGFVQFGHGTPTSVTTRSCHRAAATILTAGSVCLAGCTGEFSTLQPAGPAAQHVATLWWGMLAGAAVILTGVLGTAIYALKRERALRNISSRRLLIGGGLIFPTVTLLILMAFAFLAGDTLLARADGSDDVIRVRAQQWGWTIDYPGGERTENVLHVPAGEDFTVAITSEDVIHSFWVPRLGGKMDAIPGKENRLRLQADLPGTYRGTCAEYCGIGHAQMQFEVRAHPAADYAAALRGASLRPAEDRPVLNPRRAPAANIIERWTDYLLDWLGAK
ncbi:cytochrome c oxidase subunit II [Pacificimonas sp. ICDLI1SI03]